MELNEKDVFNAIRLLDIKVPPTSHINENGWIQVHCPSDAHKRGDMRPSAAINVNNGVIRCFGCSLETNLIKLFQEEKGISYQEALATLKNISINEVLSFKEKEPQIQRTTKENVIEFKGVLVDFDPQKYEYTRLRGFDEGFCKEFKIKLSYSYPYVDYMIIPINDYEKGLKIFEARRIMDAEYSTKEDSIKERYLSKPKVLYPFNSRIKDTLFNINNLYYDREVFVCEGTGSIPKLMKVFGKNVTCTFGSKVSNAQLEYLNKFDKVTLVPDNDKEGFSFVEKINERRKKAVYVLPITLDDTADKYRTELINTKPLKANEYLLGGYF